VRIDDFVREWIRPGSRVLDLGCGDGRLLDDLARTRSVHGYGLEIDPHNIKLCVARGVNVLEQDLDRGLGNFADRSFDTVVMTQTLQAVRFPHLVLDEMLRVGREGCDHLSQFRQLALPCLPGRARTDAGLALPAVCVVRHAQYPFLHCARFRGPVQEQEHPRVEPDHRGRRQSCNGTDPARAKPVRAHRHLSPHPMRAARMRMPANVLALWALLFVLPAAAEQRQFGQYDVYYSLFTADFLQPDVARTLDIVRAKDRAVLNIAVRRRGEGGQDTPVAAVLEGSHGDLIHKTALEFREVAEDEARYYLAQFPFRNGEAVYLELRITPQGERTPARAALRQDTVRAVIPRELVVATGNAGKLGELHALLAGLQIAVRSQDEFGIVPVEETRASASSRTRSSRRATPARAAACRHWRMTRVLPSTRCWARRGSTRRASPAMLPTTRPTTACCWSACAKCRLPRAAPAFIACWCCCATRGTRCR
jgi:SAM-dependent methyltransferase